MAREVTIPGMFRELHGEKSRLSTLYLVYLTALLSTAWLVIQLLPFRMAVWRYVLAGLVVADISGGVVANLSSSTNQYYQARRNLRIPFLLVHFIQPLALYFVFPQYPGFFIFLTVYTLLASLFINAIKDREFQQNLAASVLTVGVFALIAFDIRTPILYIIGSLYMIKLILGFTVRRPSFEVG